MLSIFKRFGVSTDVNLRLSSGLFEVITTGLQVDEVASVPLMRVNQVRLMGVDWVFKTALDIVMAVVMLLVFLPVMAVIALVIRLDSPGKVFYRRQVMGLNGAQFLAYKFRTMHSNGDEILAAHPEMQVELAETHKLKHDPRVTRVGRVLRKYSLDELPQLFNVLRREMSVVGPRIIAPEELAMYEQWDMNLLTVPPGMTGLWQVSGRSDVSYAERVQLDMRYIRNWSIWLDMQILMRTIVVVIKGRGAY
jgi:exopolysaccharide biosynthesis polyprenyl glycosylphosphotransferase